MEKMKHIVFAIVSILLLAHSTSLKVGLLSAMDDYVATMEKERASMDFTREIDVSESLEKRIAACKLNNQCISSDKHTHTHFF